jgi:hypothetical protein
MKIKLIIATLILLFLIAITMQANLTNYLKINMIVACAIVYIIHSMMTITKTNKNER